VVIFFERELNRGIYPLLGCVRDLFVDPTLIAHSWIPSSGFEWMLTQIRAQRVVHACLPAVAGGAERLEHGWSRSVLTMQIETAAHGRAGNALTNFADRLPPPQSDLARDALKDPYILNFLGLAENAQERDIERALTQHITRFLLELGAGFAFVGSQYRLEGKEPARGGICAALRGVANSMGVAEYQLLRHVPESLESGLPSIDQIEAEFRPDLPDAQR
jgi:hypothetical protein